jgi:hypothetical protein
VDGAECEYGALGGAVVWDAFGWDWVSFLQIPLSILVVAFECCVVAEQLTFDSFLSSMIAAFMAVNTYLIDAFTMYAASAMAANTILRSVRMPFQ